MRLKTSGEFEKAYRRGAVFRGRFFSIHVLPGGLERPRLGLSVSRKVGSAVVRNRVRRQLREIFWSTVDDLRVNADLVVSARPPAVNASFGDLKGEFLRALRKLELLEREG